MRFVRDFLRFSGDLRFLGRWETVAPETPIYIHTTEPARSCSQTSLPQYIYCINLKIHPVTTFEKPSKCQKRPNPVCMWQIYTCIASLHQKIQNKRINGWISKVRSVQLPLCTSRDRHGPCWWLSTIWSPPKHRLSRCSCLCVCVCVSVCLGFRV